MPPNGVDRTSAPCPRTRVVSRRKIPERHRRLREDRPGCKRKRSLLFIRLRSRLPLMLDPLTYCAGRARVVRETNASVFLCMSSDILLKTSPRARSPSFVLSHCASFAEGSDRASTNRPSCEARGAWRTVRDAGSKSIIFDKSPYRSSSGARTSFSLAGVHRKRHAEE